MDSLKDWAIALCAAAVMCAAAEMIVPCEKQNRAMKMLISTIMLCLLVKPLTDLCSCSFDASDIYSPDYEPNRRLCATVETQTADAVTDSIKTLIGGVAEDEECSVKDISISVNILDDGCISIGQITVVLAAEHAGNVGHLKGELFSRLGLDAEVITEEAGNEQYGTD